MRSTKWTQIIAAAVVIGTLSTPAVASAQWGPWRDSRAQNQREYDQGYQAGIREGQRDAQRNRPYEARPSNSGSPSRDGDYRNGFADGYRIGYQQARGTRGWNGRPNTPPANARRPGVYQEPALARGFSDGYERGLSDGRDGDRYDPVGERDYRNGDEGYYSQYGSRDAYKNNYRTGFRQGYENGYRDGQQRRR